MELKTIAECDVALHCLDMLLGEHVREFDESLKIANEHNNKAAIALKQRNVVRSEMDAIEERKKWLGCNQLIESEAKRLVSSQTPSTGANAAEGVFEMFNVITNVAELQTLND